MDQRSSSLCIVRGAGDHCKYHSSVDEESQSQEEHITTGRRPSQDESQPKIPVKSQSGLGMQKLFLLHDMAPNLNRPNRLRDSSNTLHNNTVDLMFRVNTVLDAQSSASQMISRFDGG
jgi:hypothetical protein